MKEKYKDGIDMSNLKHIPEVSFYNHNYYIGLNHDILVETNDDVSDECEWSILTDSGKKLLGYTGMDNKLELSDFHHN